MRTVVISGGGTGIGRATAELLARDGERVLIVGRRAEVLARTAAEIGAAVPTAPAVETAAADLADPGQVEQLGARIAGELGRVDVLVNCAGGNVDLRTAAPPPNGLAGTAESWTGNLRANVLTTVLLTEALRDVLTSPGGRVVLISSIAAYRGSGGSSYGPAKAALHPYAFDLAAGPRPARHHRQRRGPRLHRRHRVLRRCAVTPAARGADRADAHRPARLAVGRGLDHSMAGVRGGEPRHGAGHPGQRRGRAGPLTPPAGPGIAPDGSRRLRRAQVVTS